MTSGGTTSYAAFLHCPMCRTLGCEHGAPMSHKLKTYCSTTLSQTKEPEALLIGSQSLNHIYSNNTHGHHKAELPISLSSTNHLFLPSPAVYGRRANQHTGNSCKQGSTLSSISPTKRKEPPEVSSRLSKMHHIIGPGIQHGPTLATTQGSKNPGADDTYNSTPT